MQAIQINLKGKVTDSTVKMRLRLKWPEPALCNLRENFFVGVWRHYGEIFIEWEDPPAAIAPICRMGSNWAMLSNASLMHGQGTGLVHSSKQTSSAVAFRGYVLSPPIHSYSSEDAIVAYWSGEPTRVEHNGIFSVALVHNQGKILTLMTDFLGMGPLYYRRFADAVIFSTNPRWLTVAGDSPDLLAWRCLIQAGFISSDRSLSSQVRRVPSGTAIRFSSEGEEKRYWFDYSSFPKGKRPVDDRASAEVEAEFQDTISRCLRLQNESIVLPLSSGFDSRRILATFLRRKVDFQALTARVLQKECRDLDARFAKAMAVEFGFPHTIVEMGGASKYGQDDFSRRVLVDAETHMHTWVVRLMESLPQRPCIFFDGIAGDILGNPGYRMEGLYHSPPEDLELIVNSSITNEFESLLSHNEWPSKLEVKEDIKDYLKPFLDRANIAEIAFILLRQRRSTSLWSQQLLPSGHVVVCPYLDLNYVRRMLEYIPADKHRTVFQRRCLSEFWPEFFKYPGNRDIPGNLPRGTPSIENERNLACYHRLNEEIKAHDINGIYFRLMTRNARFRHYLSLINKKVAVNNLWFLNRIMELCSREIRNKACWDFA